jgi:hypothetical protein
MHDRLIEALLAKNWSYSMIALRAQICEHRLRSGNLGRRESERLMKVAEQDARIDLDMLEVDE